MNWDGLASGSIGGGEGGRRVALGMSGVPTWFLSVLTMTEIS